MPTSESTKQKSRSDRLRGLVKYCTLLICLFASTLASAKDYSFGWSANTEPTGGYKIYYKKGGIAGPPFDGKDATNGPSPIDMGKQTTFTITGLEDNTTYHFAMTAYNGAEESEYTQIITVFPRESSATSSPINNKEFVFSWDPTLENGVTAHRFYINDQLLCQSTTPSEGSHTCYADLLNETMYFTMTTMDNQGKESAKSNILIYEPPPPSKAFTFTWNSTLETGVTAHRFFINEQLLCQSTNIGEESLTCYADLLNETMFFTMTTVDSQDNESAKSNILLYNPTEEAISPLGPSTTVNWEAAPVGTTVSGYKIYHNNILIGEITDPSVHEYTSALPLDPTNIFTVMAYDSSGVASKVASTISYTSDPESANSASLAAVIITNNQTGEAPLTTNFDGSGSQGPVTSYAWSFGDGDSANGATVAHNYQFAGTYTAALTVTDAHGLSQQTNIAITVSASTAGSTPPVTGPTAVIASSGPVGDAPFAVTFDGSGSTSPQPAITSYSWAFGDGTTAEGSVVSHTYTLSGIYSPSLTVCDSAGLTDQISTPVIITPGPEQTTNQPPQSMFVVTPGYGVAPLVVAFDGSGSKDTDGSIKSYLWSFGDGTTATGSTTEHTFTEIATYTVSLQVTDDMGGTAVSSQMVAVRAEGDPQLNVELQEIQLDHNWTRFNFTQPYSNPVVVAGPASFNAADPTTVRIRNIDATGCEIRIQEWEYLDGVHVPETLSFIVMEKGTFTLKNGSKIEAGTFTGATSFKKINLQQAYKVPPVILTQVTTDNETDAVLGRLRNINTSSFEYILQEGEQTATGHGIETIGYIAWEPGTGTVIGLPYEAGLTAQTITDNWSDISMQTAFPDLPLLLAKIQTYNSGDTAGLRSQKPTKNSIQVKIEEERSADEETTHVAEVVGYLTIGAQKSTLNPATPSSWIKQFLFTWESVGSEDVTGYRFYLNNNILCESANPTERQHACQAALVNDTMQFSMTSVLFDGSETEPQNMLSISPADSPDLFGIRMVTFTWEYDSTLEGNISGFGMYNNNSLVCETTNTGDRQLTCKVPLDAQDNVFSVRAKSQEGIEASSSNTLKFTP